MDIQKKIDRLDDDHIAFRKKVSEYEWDYQDMRREAKNVSEQMSEWQYVPESLNILFLYVRLQLDLLYLVQSCVSSYFFVKIWAPF